MSRNFAVIDGTSTTIKSTRSGASIQSATSPGSVERVLRELEAMPTTRRVQRLRAGRGASGALARR